MRLLLNLLTTASISLAGIMLFHPSIFEPAQASETILDAATRETVRTVRFVDHNPSDPFHSGEGSATIYRDANNNYEVVFNDDFRVNPGPNFHVYFSAYDKIRRSGHFKKADNWRLGKLKNFSGSQSFAVPKDVDISKAKSLVVWCKTFRILIVTADF